jgi:hypothetical protein
VWHRREFGDELQPICCELTSAACTTRDLEVVPHTGISGVSQRLIVPPAPNDDLQALRQGRVAFQCAIAVASETKTPPG